MPFYVTYAMPYKNSILPLSYYQITVWCTVICMLLTAGGKSGLCVMNCPFLLSFFLSRFLLNFLLTFLLELFCTPTLRKCDILIWSLLYFHFSCLKFTVSTVGESIRSTEAGMVNSSDFAEVSTHYQSVRALQCWHITKYKTLLRILDGWALLNFQSSFRLLRWNFQDYLCWSYRF